MLLMGGQTIHPNLVAWYKLDGNSLDSGPSGYNGTDTDMSYGSGLFNQAGVFNGSSSRISIDGVTALAFVHNTGIFTICAWVKKTVVAGAGIIIGNTASNAEKGFFLGISQSVSGSIDFRCAVGTSGTYGFICATGASALPNTNWHHVAISVNFGAATGVIYVDGVAKTSTNVFTSTSTGNDTRAHNIGRFPSGASYYNGSIDDLQIYNTNLTQTQIQNIMSSQYP